MQERRIVPYLNLQELRQLLKEFDDKYYSFWDNIFGSWPGVDEFRDFLSSKNYPYLNFLNIISSWGWWTDVLPLLSIILRAERRDKLKNSPVGRLFQDIQNSLFQSLYIDQAYLNDLIKLENAGISLKNVMFWFGYLHGDREQWSLLKVGLLHIKSLYADFEDESFTVHMLSNIIEDLTRIFRNQMIPTEVPEDLIKRICEACIYQRVNNFYNLLCFLMYDEERSIKRVVAQERMNMLCELIKKDPRGFDVQTSSLLPCGGRLGRVIDREKLEELMQAYRKKLKPWQQAAPFIAAMRANAGNPLAIGAMPLMQFTVQQYLHGGIKREPAPDAEIKSTSTNANLSPKTKPAKPLFFAGDPGLDAKEPDKPLTEDDVRQNVYNFILELSKKQNADEKLSKKSIEVHLIEMLGEVHGCSIHDLRVRVGRAIRAVSGVGDAYKETLLGLDRQLRCHEAPKRELYAR